MFNATFNNISVTWRKPSTYHWQTLSHNVKSSTPCHEIQLPSPYDHALPPLWECVKSSTPCHKIQLPYDHALPPLWECVKSSTPCNEIQLPYDHALPPLWECVKSSTPCHEIQLPYDHALPPLWEWKVFVSNLLTAYSPVLYLKIKKKIGQNHM